MPRRGSRGRGAAPGLPPMPTNSAQHRREINRRGKPTRNRRMETTPRRGRMPSRRRRQHRGGDDTDAEARPKAERRTIHCSFQPALTAGKPDADGQRTHKAVSRDKIEIDTIPTRIGSGRRCPSARARVPCKRFLGGGAFGGANCKTYRVPIATVENRIIQRTWGQANCITKLTSFTTIP